MNRVWHTPAKILTGLFVTAMCAMPQAYTISARPGVVNYIEGNASLNGHEVSATKLKSTFLNANDVLSTDIGKAEVLLTPGVFLRIGDNTQIRMISPSLTDTQVQLERGDAMIEVDDLVKGNQIGMLNHGGSVSILKTGLYRFSTDPEPVAAVIEGKAAVTVGDSRKELSKGHQVVLVPELKAEKFDKKKQDDLYAWSNVRSEYEAASSYQAAKDAGSTNYGSWGGLGFAGGYGSGWYWNSGFNSWAWLPMNGAFYSPFGYGFYGPAVLPYAPVVVAPIYAGGGYVRGHNGHWNPGNSVSKTAAVPVSPTNPPAVGRVSGSPYANQAARSQAARSAYANGGFRNATGAPAGSFGGRRVSGGGVRMGAPRGVSGAGGPSRGWSGAAGRPGGSIPSSAPSSASAGHGGVAHK